MFVKNPTSTFEHRVAFEDLSATNSETLIQMLCEEMHGQVKASTKCVESIVIRISKEVQRICDKSSRIQKSGQVISWQITLAQHRLQKCLRYYHLGSKQGRIELQNSLGALVYRHVTSAESDMGFDARYNLIEDFLQAFYIEAIKAFRRENELPDDYTPRTQLQLAECLAFTERYAKRRINLPSGTNQQLVVLRAQAFAHRQRPETTIDFEIVVDFAKTEEAESYQRNLAIQQIRSKMIAKPSSDSSEESECDRLITELMNYLESQGQSDCMDYLSLKMQDLSVPEIDQVLGLTSRQRDYLQQRFKYHVEKFTKQHQWQLVHEWLGAGLEHKLGLSSQQWEIFWHQLTEQQQQIFKLKNARQNDQVIAKTVQCTPKQLQKRWTKMLELAWSIRNGK
jgi:hypothetical protein